MNNRRLPLVSRKQFEAHTTVKSCWVTLYNRNIYDVTNFLDEHPAGSELILEYAGKDITQILADPSSHTHSESVYEMLNDEMLIGYLATPEEEEELLSKHQNMEVIPDTIDLTEFGELPSEQLLSVRTDVDEDYRKHKFLDLNKPLLIQVLTANWTKEFYLDQVHRPRHYGKGSAPLFGNFLEPLSVTPWYVVPLIWLPVNFYVFYIGFVNQNKFLALALWALGLFVWTLIEYVMHRFLFHIDNYLPEHQLAFTVHFLLHGVHHYLPMDKKRLVMPPTLFIVLCYPFYKLVFAILPYYAACSGFAGGFLGYILYDCTHYILHHAKLPKYLQDLKTYHLEHHYKNYELGFGVTSKFWDRVFGTLLNPEDVYQKRN
ncbi:hypothetical protein KL905_000479 [Ogataea polymorpha]|uniref:Ceramide very long chain fatty acid hydroxylase n=2 Tax=Saccharomycotina TaxID=147537 RepID=A0A1B7SI88_9ASCO|nr:uncharacterized protein OGAPODRAFT_15994 [Ogataea polymorpha]KAG7882027.1 hypothetical protein KL937_000598 [Ogataea polymorpha]KAG7891889.1 hypothetical protein KL936_001832 [Ogataea polymorpha]KAG7895242.1 hypothetical protein KL908_001592 [Ogataea polymorpha]KAG7911736.1 hypothetical protein KL906_001057 [Ogataea polymorpha]KAG7912429.1 hypothetical protein KL907_000631 [Ogataea polymorpha]